MSLGYSKTGLTWDKSSFGKQMSCVVLSEVLDHADVKLHTDGELSTRSNKLFEVKPFRAVIYYP